MTKRTDEYEAVITVENNDISVLQDLEKRLGFTEAEIQHHSPILPKNYIVPSPYWLSITITPDNIRSIPPILIAVAVRKQTEIKIYRQADYPNPDRWALPISPGIGDEVLYSRILFEYLIMTDEEFKRDQAFLARPPAFLISNQTT